MRGTGFNSALVHKRQALRRLRGRGEEGQVRRSAQVGAEAQCCVTLTGRVNPMFKHDFFRQLIEGSLIRATDNVHIRPLMNRATQVILTGCIYRQLSQLSGCKVISRDNTIIVLL